MSLEDYEHPVYCPNCWDEGREAELIYSPDEMMPRLFFQITVFGTCVFCQYSVACIYSFKDDAEESEVFHVTNH